MATIVLKGRTNWVRLRLLAADTECFRAFMSDVTTTGEGAPQGVVSDVARPARSPFAAARNNRSLRILGFVVVFASVLMSSISFLILSGTTNIEPSTTVWTVIWIVTGILVLLMIALVVTEALLLIQGRMQRQRARPCRFAW